jgi:hypothetical protein
MKGFESLLSLALWLAGIGHFCILIASVQVPARLGWREDFRQLTPFNRKLVWVYAVYTLFTIVAFGVLTLLLHDEFLHGDRAAAALAVFIAIYWTARVLIDLFLFDHRDWPRGRLFVVGHVLLVALFTALAGTYWAAVLRRWLFT